MTQEKKRLLLIDLCDRLPYGVKIHIDFNEIGHIVGDATLDCIKTITGQFDFDSFEQDFKNGDCLPIGGLCGNKLLHIDEFKPYLRPMSSMTDEEKEGLYQKTGFKIDDCILGLSAIDWLNAHHFDYRGLIEKGLAIEAPEGMYKIGNE